MSVEIGELLTATPKTMITKLPMMLSKLDKVVFEPVVMTNDNQSSCVWLVLSPTTLTTILVVLTSKTTKTTLTEGFSNFLLMSSFVLLCTFL